MWVNWQLCDEILEFLRRFNGLWDHNICSGGLGTILDTSLLLVTLPPMPTQSREEGHKLPGRWHEEGLRPNYVAYQYESLSQFLGTAVGNGFFTNTKVP